MRRGPRDAQAHVRLRNRVHVNSINDEQLECSYCHSGDVVYDHRNGNLVCRSCARVIDTHRIDWDQEWMTFDREGGQQMPRGSGPDNPLLGGIGLATSVEATREGRALNRSSRRQRRGRESRLQKAFNQIGILCERINLTPNLVTKAKEVYKDLWDKRAIRGKSSQVFYATCIYFACKLSGSQRTLNEITSLTGIHKRDVGRCFKHIQKVLGGKIAAEVARTGGANVAQAQAKLVVRWCHNLQLPHKITSVVEHAAERINRAGILQGRQRGTVAAAIIYTVCQMAERKCLPEDIQEVSAVAPATILQAYRELLRRPNWEQEKAVIFPQRFLESISRTKAE